MIAHGDAVHKRAERDLKDKKEYAALLRKEKRDKNRIQALEKHECEALTKRERCQVCPPNPVVPIHPKMVNGKREREEDDDFGGEGCL